MTGTPKDLGSGSSVVVKVGVAAYSIHSVSYSVPHRQVRVMDDSSHLSVVLDLPPSQWHRSAHNNPPLSLPEFLSHVFVFLNAHIANNAENSLAVFGAFPGNSLMLYSSADPVPEHLPIDPNSYPSFNHLDHAVSRRIHSQLDSLSDSDAQRPPLPCLIPRPASNPHSLHRTLRPGRRNHQGTMLSVLP